jgi:hypothetical protein
MSGVKGAGGPSCVASSGPDPFDRVATVRKGETTLKQVAERLGLTEEALRKANPHIKNPNELKAGQDICLPEGTRAPAPPAPQEKTARPGPNNPDGGPKLPKGRVGDYEIPLPKPMTSTTDIYDGGVTGTRRRAEQEGLDRTRPRDDRDLDPKVLERDKKERIEHSAKTVDRALKEGFDNALKEGSTGKTKTMWLDQMDEFYRQQSQRLGGAKQDPK